jgi:dienelactone hydrolase
MFKYFEDGMMLTQGFQLAMNCGADINEVDRACKASVVVDGVPEPGAWYDAWVGVGLVLEAQAAEDEKKGRKVSASNKYRRASVYHGIAERYIPHTDARKLDAYRKMLATFRKHAELANHPVEWVEIPYGEKTLPGLFIPASVPGPVPTVIFVDGFDLYKELVYLRKNHDAARLRGMAMLIVDTPGIGEALRLRGITARHDTEVPVGACVDWLEKRADVDAKRIGLIGLSMGGYYAPRAAAFEKRIKALVAWGAQWDIGERWRTRTKGTVDKANLSAPHEQLLWVTGQPTLAAAVDFVGKFTLEPVAAQITIPFLITHGENDHLISAKFAETLAAASVNSPRVDLVITTPEYGGEGHCSLDNMQTGVDIIYDWLAEQLGGSAAGVSAR